VLGYTSPRGFGAIWPLVSADEREPMFVIQHVPEPKLGKNRMHLDIHVTDVSSEAKRLDAFGAKRVSEDVITNQHSYQWLVMADPEGNEFCIVQDPA
jgi:predicted enzyme related to lactoylglutathione lyase